MTTTTIPAAPSAEGIAIPVRQALAAARIALGFVFFWAFLDKAFGLAATPKGRRSELSAPAPWPERIRHRML